MNFILNHQYSDGNTRIRPEEAEQPIPKISTMAELNEYEALNILEAQRWAFSTRTMNSTNPLDESYVRTLHAKMFDQVWKWAGTYRKHELNIGCDPHEITQRSDSLVSDPAIASKRERKLILSARLNTAQQGVSISRFSSQSFAGVSAR